MIYGAFKDLIRKISLSIYQTEHAKAKITRWIDRVTGHLTFPFTRVRDKVRHRLNLLAGLEVFGWLSDDRRMTVVERLDEGGGGLVVL